MIDEARVRHIAKLSRLKLNDDEVRLFSGQLAKIIEYVNQLESIDTAGIEPLAHPALLQNALREDVPREGLDSDSALANAPQKEGPFFRVPKVLDPASGA